MCVVWGIPFLLIKVAVGGVSVPVVVFARTALGAAILLPAALRSGQLAALRAHWRPLLAFAVLEMIVPWGLLSSAEEHLPSSPGGPRHRAGRRRDPGRAAPGRRQRLAGHRGPAGRARLCDGPAHRGAQAG